MREERPRVLILGGSGFIGRNFVEYLVSNQLCSYIRVVDKTLSALTFLSEKHKSAFADPTVHFVQADLSREEHAEKSFNCEDGQFTYVFNLCGETRFGLADQEYQKNTLRPAENCGRLALAHPVEKFVELSTAHVYKPDKDATTENGEIAPWTIPAKYRFEAEEALRAMDGLPLVVLRPAMVYGPGDLTSLTPRMSTAAVYGFLKEKMKFLWTKDLKINTVHVHDVCVALWASATKIAPGTTLNLADKTRLDQGQLNNWLGELFGIKTGFHGSIISNLAKLSFDSVVATANEKHVPGWQKLCQSHKILNTPISPFLDGALLCNNHLSIDGSAITEITDFEYTRAEMSKESLREQIDLFIEQGIFPPVLNNEA